MRLRLRDAYLEHRLCLDESIMESVKAWSGIRRYVREHNKLLARRERRMIRQWNRTNGKRLNHAERRIATGKTGIFPGDRVGAIMNDGHGPPLEFGCGVYMGCKPWMPVIRLDSGESLYGSECWWTKEEDHTRALFYLNPNIQPITVAEARERWDAREREMEEESND